VTDDVERKAGGLRLEWCPYTGRGRDGC